MTTKTEPLPDALAEVLRLADEMERIIPGHSQTYGWPDRLRALAPSLQPMADDARRLDVLDARCVAYGFEETHEGNRWCIDGPYRTIRDAIDALNPIERE